MSWHSRLARSRSLLGMLVLLAAAHARAANDPPDQTDAEGDDHHSHLILGMKGVRTIERVTTEDSVLTRAGYGFATVAETTVLHGRIGLELDLVFTEPGNEVSIAGEPMLKLPWHFRAWLEPYVAAGPLALNVRDERGHHYWMGGGQLVFGAFLWIAELAGIDLDFALGAAHGPEITMAEVTIALGPVLRN
jgi:hypothetical protein